FGANAALGRARDWIAFSFGRDDGRILMDRHTRGACGAREPQAIIERVKMPGTPLAQGPMIDGGAELSFELLSGEDLRVGVAELGELVLPFLQMIELGRLGYDMQISPFQIAIDLVFGNSIGDEPLRFFDNFKALRRI